MILHIGVTNLEKGNLRKAIIGKLKSLSDQEKQAVESKISQHLFSTDLWNNATHIGVTISQGFEWSTKLIIEKAWEEKKIACVPKCSPQEKTLQFYELNSYDQLETVYYNLLEPKPEETKKMTKQDIDLLIVPGVVFNKKGYRIGFGGGFYDRFLVGFPHETISLISSLQLVEDLPIESHDLPVQHVITEKGLVK